MSLLAPGRVLAAALALTWAGAVPARAAASPDAPVLLAQQDDTQDSGGDAAGLVLRIGRLEEQIRSLTGQVEQLQFQNRKLEETLRKAQADNDFRLKDLEGAAAGGSAGAAQPRPPAAASRRSDADGVASTPTDATADATPAVKPASRRASDAFDPATDPAAPGAPKPLGTTTPSQPLATRPARTAAADTRGAPLDLMRPQAGTVAATPPDEVARTGAPVTPLARDPAAVASLAPGGTREEYDADLGLYKQGAYDGAATGFKAFASKYPKDRLVPDAVFLAGESYARLGRHSEAVEQFLRVFTDYGKSPRAPDALLRLGISLNAMGQREQACATYQEVTRRYPSASSDVRSAVDRELKRARCTGDG